MIEVKEAEMNIGELVRISGWLVDRIGKQLSEMDRQIKRIEDRVQDLNDTLQRGTR